MCGSTCLRRKSIFPPSRFQTSQRFIFKDNATVRLLTDAFDTWRTHANGTMYRIIIIGNETDRSPVTSTHSPFVLVQIVCVTLQTTTMVFNTCDRTCTARNRQSREHAVGSRQLSHAVYRLHRAYRARGLRCPRVGLVMTTITYFPNDRVIRHDRDCGKKHHLFFFTENRVLGLFANDLCVS